MKMEKVNETRYQIRVRRVFNMAGDEVTLDAPIPLLLLDTLVGAEDICKRFSEMGLWEECTFEPEPITFTVTL
jgi:hypothetical protein